MRAFANIILHNVHTFSRMIDSIIITVTLWDQSKISDKKQMWVDVKCLSSFFLNDEIIRPPFSFLSSSSRERKTQIRIFVVTSDLLRAAYTWESARTSLAVMMKESTCSKDYKSLLLREGSSCPRINNKNAHKRYCESLYKLVLTTSRKGGNISPIRK